MSHNPSIDLAAAVAGVRASMAELDLAIAALRSEAIRLRSDADSAMAIAVLDRPSPTTDDELAAAVAALVKEHAPLLDAESDDEDENEDEPASGTVAIITGVTEPATLIDLDVDDTADIANADDIDEPADSDADDPSRRSGEVAGTGATAPAAPGGWPVAAPTESAALAPLEAETPSGGGSDVERPVTAEARTPATEAEAGVVHDDGLDAIETSDRTDMPEGWDDASNEDAAFDKFFSSDVEPEPAQRWLLNDL